jgi:hypothetical protein
MVGGAWPFLVGGVNRLLNCDNERDLHFLKIATVFGMLVHLEGHCVSNARKSRAITGL